jgi:predicted CopG family antitoxin
MQKSLTISIEADLYDALQRVVGRGKISKFLQDLARPHVMKEDLSTAYQAMAADTEREKEALEWSNGLIGDVAEADSAAR